MSLFADADQLPGWVTIVATAVATGIATFIATTTTGVKQVLDAWFANKAKSIGRRQYSNAWVKYAQFYTHVQMLYDLDFVDRVLVVRGQNGGGMPKPGGEYSLIAFICHSATHPEVGNQYNFSINADPYDLQVIGRVIELNRVMVKTSDIPEGSRLKGLYQLEGVVHTGLYFLGIVDSQLIYLSLANYSREFTPTELDRVNVYVDRIRSAMA